MRSATAIVLTLLLASTTARAQPALDAAAARLAAQPQQAAALADLASALEARGAPVLAAALRARALTAVALDARAAQELRAALASAMGRSEVRWLAEPAVGGAAGLADLDARSQGLWSLGAAEAALRAGDAGAAQKAVSAIPSGTEAWVRGQLLLAALESTRDPNRGAAIALSVLQQGGLANELRIAAALSAGRSLYAAHRFPEAAAAFAQVPRDSLQWPQALYEAAYAELRAGDAGASLGKLLNLRAPQLRDRWVPEAHGLAALVLLESCLYPQARDELKGQEDELEPALQQLAATLGTKDDLHVLAVASGAAPGLDLRLRRELLRDDRTARALAAVGAMEREAQGLWQQTSALDARASQAVRSLLLETHDAAALAAGRQVRSRLTAIQRRFTFALGQAELVRFEVLKGEKELLSHGQETRSVLAAQTLRRPARPNTGVEYWPFDGEFWWDEVGAYHATLKNACAAREAKPTLAVDDQQVERKRQEMIDDLGRVLPRIDDPSIRPDLVFELGQLWWESARASAMAEAKEFDASQRAWIKLRDAGHKPLPPEPVLTNARSAPQREKAFALYRQVLQEHPTYARADQVLFELGIDLLDSQRPKEAASAFRSLVATHAQSPFVADAWVQLGEIAFAGSDLASARAAYQHAAQSGTARVVPFAVYKLAWCDFNEHKFQDAIDKFEQVVKTANRSGARDRIQLRAEALRDAVLPFVQLDQVESAMEWLRRSAGPQDAPRAIQRLGDAYFEGGKFERAIAVYRGLLAENGDHELAPTWQQKVMIAYDRMNQRGHVREESERLVMNYGPQSGWAKKHQQSKAVRAQADDEAQAALRSLAEDYHQEALKTKDATTYRLAAEIYRRFADTYPQAADAPRMRFYLAEILFALGDWAPAGDQYGRAAEADPKGEVAKKAALDSILAWEKQVAVERGQPQAAAPAGPVEERREKGGLSLQASTAVPVPAVEQPLTTAERAIVAACDRFMRIAPGAKEALEVEYKAAFSLYEKGHAQEAGPRFLALIARAPRSPWSVRAADLAMNELEIRKDWSGLSKLAADLSQNKLLTQTDPDLGRRAGTVAENARFNAAIVRFQAGDAKGAEADLRSYVAAYPQSSHSVVALYDLTVMAEKAGRPAEVVVAADRLLREHPTADPKMLAPALISLASAYHQLGRQQESARAAEVFVDKFPAHPRAADLLFDAAVFHERLGEDALAARDLSRYADLFPARPDAAQARFDALRLAVAQKGDEQKAASYADYLKRARKERAPQALIARAAALRAIALQASRASEPKLRAALDEAERSFAAVPTSQRSSELVDLAAHARFLSTDPLFAKFKAARFRSANQSQLAHTLREREKLLNQLNRALTAVVAQGSPVWAQAALSRAGDAYRDFEKALLEAPAPRGLDEEQRALYRSALENKALPLEDKAIGAYEKAVQTAARTGVASDWADAAAQSLDELQPGRRPRSRKLPLELVEAFAAAPAPPMPKAPQLIVTPLSGNGKAALAGEPSPEELRAQASLAAAARDLPRARELLARYCAARPSDALAARQLAGLARAQGDRAAAMGAELSAAAAGSDEAALLAAAQDAIAAGVPGKVEPALRAALAKAPENSAPPALQLAQISLLREEGQLDAAQALAERLVRGAPKAAAPHVALARVLLKRGHLEAARAELSAAHQADPTDLPAQLVQAALLAQEGHGGAARDALTQAVGLAKADDPALAAAHAALGVLGLRAYDFGLAARAFGQSVRLDPSRADRWVAQGWALEATGQPALAEGAFERALALRGGEPEALLGRARTLRAQRRLAEAKAAFLACLGRAGSAGDREARTALASLALEMQQQKDNAAATSAAVAAPPSDGGGDAPEHE